jgi:deoxyadenosine/deoxycytidine kinase
MCHLEPRIEICGGIASGKTTLARLLKRVGFRVVLEAFGTNPYLPLFYKARRRYALETETSFALLHTRQVLGITSPAAFDFSLALDSAYSDVTLRGWERDVFQALMATCKACAGEPLLIVHLRCGTAELVRRIRSRGRAVEQHITRIYLQSLNDAIEEEVTRLKDTSLVTIDSEKINFASDRMQRTDTSELIRDVFARAETLLSLPS